MGRKEKVLYVLIDPKDKYEFPIFVGTLSELADFTGSKKDSIVTSIRKAKQNGHKCKYKRIDPMEEE